MEPLNNPINCLRGIYRFLLVPSYASSLPSAILFTVSLKQLPRESIIRECELPRKSKSYPLLVGLWKEKGGKGIKLLFLVLFPQLLHLNSDQLTLSVPMCTVLRQMEVFSSHLQVRELDMDICPEEESWLGLWAKRRDPSVQVCCDWTEHFCY